MSSPRVQMISGSSLQTGCREGNNCEIHVVTADSWLLPLDSWVLACKCVKVTHIIHRRVCVYVCVWLPSLGDLPRWRVQRGSRAEQSKVRFMHCCSYSADGDRTCCPLCTEPNSCHTLCVNIGMKSSITSISSPCSPEACSSRVLLCLASGSTAATRLCQAAARQRASRTSPAAWRRCTSWGKPPPTSSASSAGP